MRKQVEIGGKTYFVHLDNSGTPVCVVVCHKGRPYRNIGLTGPAAKAAIEKAMA